MKRFAFRLAVLLRVKLSNEKEQKARLLEIQERLRRLIAELDAMIAQRENLSRMYVDEARSGITGERLLVFGRYFDHLRDAMSEQQKRIDEAKLEKAKRQAELLRTMKEIKALKKLREAQYAEYLAEVAREEEKAIGDIVSFNVTVGS